MARISNPITFSKAFNVSPSSLTNAGLADPFLNADTKLFIDLSLIEYSGNNEISIEADKTYNNHMKATIDFVALSERKNDFAWRQAKNMLDLSEASEICMGFGGSSNSGSQRPEHIKIMILNTIHDAIKIGMANPDLMKFISIIEEGIGPDTISDMTTNIIKPHLAKITQNFARSNSIPTKKFKFADQIFSLPENRYANRSMPVLLVPTDILRDLPIATDWTDLDSVIQQNQELRDKMNRVLIKYADASVSQKKKAIRD